MKSRDEVQAFIRSQQHAFEQSQTHVHVDSKDHIDGRPAQDVAQERAVPIGIQLTRQDLEQRARDSQLQDIRDGVALAEGRRSLFDGEMVTNAAGGRQSRTPGVFYQLPANGILAFREGSKMLAHKVTSTSVDRFDYWLDQAWLYLCELLADRESRVSLASAIYALSCAIQVHEGPLDDDAFFRTFGYRGLLRCAQVMDAGAVKYGRGNWRRIEYWSQVDHTLQHLIAFEEGDESAYKPQYGAVKEKAHCNLWNALCRLVFAAEVFDPKYRFTAIEEPQTTAATAIDAAAIVVPPSESEREGVQIGPYHVRRLEAPLVAREATFPIAYIGFRSDESEGYHPDLVVGFMQQPSEHQLEEALVKEELAAHAAERRRGVELLAKGLEQLEAHFHGSPRVARVVIGTWAAELVSPDGREQWETTAPNQDHRFTFKGIDRAERLALDGPRYCEALKCRMIAAILEHVSACDGC